MSRLDQHMRIAILAERIASENVGWSMTDAVDMATMIVHRSAQMAFQLEVESWLETLPPVTEERP